MKKKTYRIIIFILSIIAGTLAWELVEVMIRQAGNDFTLTTNPIGIDVAVLSLYIQLNPGTAAGLLVAYLRYRAI